MRILYNGKGTWQRIYDNIRSTKDVREFFTILIRVNFNERSLDMAKLEKFFDLFSFARNDLRYRFCFRPIAPYSELNGRENSDSLACQCDEASGMRLLGLQQVRAGERLLPLGPRVLLREGRTGLLRLEDQHLCGECPEGDPEVHGRA